MGTALVRTIRNILLLQGLAGGSVVAMAIAIYGLDHLASALAGVAIAVVPNAFLGLRLTLGDPRDAKALLRAGWIGEIGKFALTVALFAMAFAALRPLYAGSLFAGFLAALLALPAAVWMGREEARATAVR